MNTDKHRFLGCVNFKKGYLIKKYICFHLVHLWIIFLKNMLTFYDSQNKPYVLGEQIGRGGEGAVFSCEDLQIVAKIYHEPIEEEKAEKLRWMARNKDEHLLKVAAWVIDVLTDAPERQSRRISDAECSCERDSRTLFFKKPPRLFSRSDVAFSRAYFGKCRPRFLFSSQTRPRDGRCQSRQLRRAGGRHGQDD